MSTTNALVWFRNDLRLADNPALTAALKHGPTTAIYIHETDKAVRPIGAAARWWLHQSLNSLAQNLASIGIKLVVRSGDTAKILRTELADHSASTLFWNRRYAQGERELDADIKEAFGKDGIGVHTFGANVLCEPWDIATLQGKPYSVFTPFARALRQRDIPRPLPKPHGGEAIVHHRVDTDYRQPKWAKKFAPYWSIGEAAAAKTLHEFLDDRLDDYAKSRDYPARSSTSHLSPHLRHGEISPRTIWHAALAKAAHHGAPQTEIDKFLTELSWRDFNYHQLFHREDIAEKPMQPKYAGMPWREAPHELSLWQQGQTGIPIVDAGMRELWETGYMQNRMRLLTASLLTKNLLIDWRIGERWFWDCLVDGDIANNPSNWQWVAGSGLDASPFFRIFNPVTQGERFDADGEYVRQWVPEVAKLPDEWIQHPFEAPPDVLRAADIELGKTYQKPMVDLRHSRERALDASKSL